MFVCYVCVLASACEYSYILVSFLTGTGQMQAKKTMANGRDDDGDDDNDEDNEEDDSQRGRR